MRCHIAVGEIEVGYLNSPSERVLHRTYWLAIPLHEAGRDDLLVYPSAHVRQEAVRKWSRWLPLVRCALATGKPVVDAVFQIDICATFLARWRRGRDSGGSGSGIQPDQDEAGKMPKRVLAGLYFASLVLAAMDGL